MELRDQFLHRDSGRLPAPLLWVGLCPTGSFPALVEPVLKSISKPRHQLSCTPFSEVWVPAPFCPLSELLSFTISSLFPFFLYP